MADDARRKVLRRRFLSLGLGELAAATVFLVIAVNVIKPRLLSANTVIALWSAVVPLLLILVQAGAYWLLARRWVKRSPMPAGLAARFRALRIITLIMLGLGLAGIIIWWPENLAVAVVAVAVWSFALVEYVNYYVVRLSYPPSRWFALVGQGRTPRLARDIRSA